MSRSYTTARPAVSAGRSIPSLDGLRAVSIMLVIVAHSSWYFPAAIQHSVVFRSIVGNGRNGVAVFFVISGYLITSLLRREFEKTETISLKHFYFRRSLRIFPPFYFFLAAMGLLWWLGWIPESGLSFLAAATYTYALVPTAGGYFIAHSWSLSIEELFYVFWPLALLIGYRRHRAVNVATILIVLMPVVRLMLYFIAPPLRGHEGYMVQGWIDTMMIGCILALLRGQPGWERIHRRLLNSWTVAALGMIGFLLLPALLLVLPESLSALISLTVKPPVLAACIGGVLVYLVENPKCLVGRILNNVVVRHVGVISYSLYLWQQLFTSDKFSMLPYGFLFALAAAEFSYWIVERPSLRLRSKLERRLVPTQLTITR